jgi:hypothetical protein
VDGPRAIGIEAAESTQTEVVVMSAENNGLIAQDWITAGQDADDVLALQGSSPAGAESRRIATYSEGLEPSAGCGLKPYLGKAPGEVRSG